jgi:hypothetical protein
LNQAEAEKWISLFDDLWSQIAADNIFVMVDALKDIDSRGKVTLKFEFDEHSHEIRVKKVDE